VLSRVSEEFSCRFFLAEFSTFVILLFSDQIFDFYQSLRPPMDLPEGVSTLYPQGNKEVMKLVRLFLDKYYADQQERVLILGINPGKFGAGVTGINFTAPRQLTELCGIPNSLKQQSELSAEFIYEVIEQYGGCARFYGDFFLSSVSPLGYTRNGKNMNYYDDKQLAQAVNPFIEKCIGIQYNWNFSHDTCICIGGEKNFKFLTKLNQKHSWFRQILPLPHPRFILQYRRRQKDQYVREYLEMLKKAKKS
jgi:hypothetical protein